MYYYVIFSDLKALFPLAYLVAPKSCSRTEFGQTYDNSRMIPDRIYGKWGVMKAWTNARYQNLLASRCYLTCKY